MFHAVKEQILPSKKNSTSQITAETPTSKNEDLKKKLSSHTWIKR
jgi:hypothetical protein